MEETKPFPADVEPWEKGMYKVSYIFFGSSKVQEGWSYWNGERWGSRSTSSEAAYDSRKTPALGPILNWKGLARNPKDNG